MENRTQIESSAIKRAMVLRDQGRSYEKIAAILRSEGYVSSWGTPYTAGSINTLVLKANQKYKTYGKGLKREKYGPRKGSVRVEQSKEPVRIDMSEGELGEAVVNLIRAFKHYMRGE
ncbi:MAG: hypothetical protein EHM49_01040 [Deltaproteobacteria bacterium]|nr:MAG: hypothetical protein EHM49_10030 [Deltaproteobacteria bacterium]RPI56104.1 MAG: hypothetical protein EHM49_01040 [Deltaproteobacteria bacterium]